MFRTPAANIIVVLGVALVVAVGTAFLLWLALGEPRLSPSKAGALTPGDVYDGIKIALTVVGGIGGVVALVVAYRRQKHAEREHQRAERTHQRAEREHAREETKLYNDRFRAASEQLGSDKSAIRMAGVYAMANLADDWTDGRQTCIDILCAYLRMPYSPPDTSRPEQNRIGVAVDGAPSPELVLGEREQHEERQVRHTVIRVIGTHLRDRASAVSWQGYNLDFTGATFDGGNFREANFSAGHVHFGEAQFVGGTVDFAEATFSGGTVDFDGATFSGGTVNFEDATFSGNVVNFGRATFSGSRVSFTGAKVDGLIHLDMVEFSGGAVFFDRTALVSGEIDFGDAEFSGSRVEFARATLSGGAVSFARAVFSGGTVSFREAQFSGSTVYFKWARFSGSTVDFEGAEFSDGTVDFEGAKIKGGTVDFRRTTFFGSMSFAAFFDTVPQGVIPPGHLTEPTGHRGATNSIAPHVTPGRTQ